jgi:hypothetical protein
LFKAAAEACNGGLRITSAAGQGTRLDGFSAVIDRITSDIAGTMLTLVVAYPTFTGFSIGPARQFVFDDEPIKVELEIFRSRAFDFDLHPGGSRKASPAYNGPLLY